MKSFYKTLMSLALVLSVFVYAGVAQSVIDPADPLVTYNPAAPPVTPPGGQIAKWVRTARLGWNTTEWKAYYLNGVPFRVKFPTTYNHTAVDGKKYPSIAFFHGLGEKGPIYDNEFSLANGGQAMNSAVVSGKFDGFIIIMQSEGGWGTNHLNVLAQIIEYMAVNNKLDPFRVNVNGLSAGGYASWDMMTVHPKIVAASLPMSGVAVHHKEAAKVNIYKYKPLWYFQGGLDNSPHPSTANEVNTAIYAAGGNYKYTLYPNLGHGTWTTAWNEPDFYPFCLRSYMSNPWPLFGRTEFCPGDPINVTIGVTAGFDAYEWRKNGTAIAGATGNTIQATTVGVYEARIRKGSLWSDWSRIPVEIKLKAPTVTPPIAVSGLMSKVIPALDSATVTLSVPEGYQSYVWQKVGSTTTISTTNTLRVTTPGDYIARVTEQFGCSSSFSTPFTVVNANGTNAPSPASNLVAGTLSKTSIKLDWSDNPSPQYNETNYEIYQATSAGGPYKLVAITAANVVTYTVDELTPKTKYFYKLRAVNNTAASVASNEASASTESDLLAPSAPTNLIVTGSSQSSVSLSWSASTDDIAVVRYEVYVNGKKAYPSATTQITVNELDPKLSYNFTVRAIDGAGNQSPFSNQATGQTLLNGLNFKHYTTTANWTALPNFNLLTPVQTGIMPTVSTAQKIQADRFGYLWEGYIQIPTTGTYYFRTASDDGSKVYLGSLNGTTSPYNFSGTAIVSNDGTHGTTTVTSAALTLTAGYYPIAIAYFDGTGGDAMTLSWRTPASGTSYPAIPASAFREPPVNNGSGPAAPSGLTATAASFKSINLSWTDNSNNESGFEIWRSTDPGTDFTPVGNSVANTNSYTDSLALEPSTRYYYQVRAIGQFGESDFATNVVNAQANWKFNGNYTDASGSGRTLTANSNPVFSTDRKEGSNAVEFNGSNQDLGINTVAGDFIRGGYTSKSIAFWMKSDVSNSNRGILDLGGSDNGLALRLNANTIQAGIASNNSRRTISAPYTSTAWNHVALVYSTNTLRLYVNGVLVASNLALGYNQIGITSNESMIGDDNGTNALNTSLGQFDGKFDNFFIFAHALTQEELTELASNTYGHSTAMTLALPALPAAPGQLIASATSTTEVSIGWSDNATTESGYEVYRSTNDELNYIKLASLAANANSYSDKDLFANAIYYYKVLAVGTGGKSAYSNTDSAKTFNNLPVLAAIANQTVHYQSTSTLNINASDVDAGNLTLSVSNLPAFATFNQSGNGVGSITFAPAGVQGSYNDIVVQVTDQSGGTVSRSFNVVVNDNFHPTVSAVNNYTLDENQSATIELTAQDQNAGDEITWTVRNLPEGYTITPGANGTATLVLQPNYAAAGTYNVEVVATDNNGGEGVSQFTLTVIDKNPNTRIFARVQYANVMGAPWNNMTGPVTNNLKNELNATTGVGISFLQSWWMPFNAGPTTGNNSGVYPDGVLNDFWYFGYYGGPETAALNVTGLNPAKKYSLTFYAGSVFDGGNNGTTRYTVGSQTVSLNVQGNTQNTVSINSLTPAANGTITVNMAKAPGTPIGYLNALVITELFDDGTAPAAPSNVAAQVVTGQGVKLSWKDVAYNEDGYQIYRATTSAGPYSQVGSADPNAVSYTDATVSGASSYFYKLRAFNAYGSSTYTDSVFVATLNRVPAINAVSNILVKNNETKTVTITAADDPSDVLTMSVKGLPSFASFVDNGNGTATISVNPGAGTLGTYSGITVTASDGSDSITTDQFAILVTDADVTSTYVNITNETNLAQKPWNNMVAPAPYAGLSISNLRDDNDVNTGISVTLTDAWQGASNSGMRAGTGQELYPQQVSRAGIYATNTASRRITVTGLNNTKRYNFVFFNSHALSESTLTNYTINGQTVSLDGSYNDSKTVQINGVAPVNGTVTINIAKAGTAATALVNAIVIQSYTPNSAAVLSPTDLRVTEAKSTSISLQWQDRADNETAYEVWRAPSGGSYTLLASLPANTTSYSNTGLTANNTYNYTVRAKLNTTNSGYSNAVKGYTYQSAVFINFNGPSRPAPAPWNNLNWVYGIGATWSSFKNEANIPTNIGMTQPVKVDGLVDLGVNTGNNSGIYPDNVMIEGFGMFPGLPTYVKLNGLSTSKTYDLTFFASVSGYFGDQTTYYTVNGKTVLLNTLNNRSGTVTMYGVQADVNGEVIISFGSYEAATFGLLGALIVKGYDKNDTESPTPPAMLTTSSDSSALRIMPRATAEDNISLSVRENTLTDDDGKAIISSFPNPFVNSFTLVVPSKGNETVQVRMYDIKGVQVFQKKVGGLIRGANQVQVNGTVSQFLPGVYIIRVDYLESGKTKSLKVLKR